uniref:Uncharacterized protein n=1 Tax=Timema tahoe TaxID=61484 RepID=A0A7R9IJH9_9NEOP|nr:unnamed protein product [Timema tahoe]
MWSTSVSRYCNDLFDTLVVDVCDTLTESADAIDLEQPMHLATSIGESSQENIQLTLFNRPCVLDYESERRTTTQPSLIAPRYRLAAAFKVRNTPTRVRHITKDGPKSLNCEERLFYYNLEDSSCLECIVESYFFTLHERVHSLLDIMSKQVTEKDIFDILNDPDLSDLEELEEDDEDENLLINQVSFVGRFIVNICLLYRVLFTQNLFYPYESRLVKPPSMTSHNLFLSQLVLSCHQTGARYESSGKTHCDIIHSRDLFLSRIVLLSRQTGARVAMTSPGKTHYRGKEEGKFCEREPMFTLYTKQSLREDAPARLHPQ